MTFLVPSGRLVGARVNRKEDQRILTGRGTYVDDMVLPGMLHAAFARSEIARGRITRLDVEDARRMPDVVAVLTAADLNPLLAGRMSATVVLDAVEPGPECVLADKEVRYVGDPYALVV